MAERVATQQQQQQQDQRKVLRIGVLQGGKVVQERLVRPGEEVTLGESPDNTFSVVGQGIPHKLTLFQAKGTKFTLMVADGMTGKVALEEGVAELDKLKDQLGISKKGSHWQIALTEKCRGKVALGELTILFQFVPAPPESARLMTHVDFRPRLFDDDDPVFLGFLALFSALGAVLVVYVFNTEPVDLVSAEDIPDRLAEILIPTQPVEPPQDLAVEQTDEGQVAKKEPKDQEPGGKDRPKTPEEARAQAAADAQKKREDTIQKSRLLSALIGTRGNTSNGMMIQDLLGQDNQMGNLDEALKNVSGGAIATQEGLDGARKGSDQSGSGDAQIGELGQATTGEGSGVGSGPGTTVKGSAAIGEMGTGDVGEGADAATKVIKTNRGTIQACYENRLKINPALRGRLVISIDVDAGRVNNVSIDENGTNDSELEACVKSNVRRWRFPAEVTGTVYPTFVLSPSG